MLSLNLKPVMPGKFYQILSRSLLNLYTEELR
jgi:hypothetical protein